MDRIFDAYNGTMGAEFMHKTRERLHWICSQVWGSRVLDVGCSQGVVPIILARMGYAVDGLDINPEAIAFANEQLAKEPQDIQSKVTYAAADFGKFVLPKDRKYDVITMSEVLEHLVRPQDFIRKAFSILPEKGRLIVTVPFGINDDPDHRQTFYLTSIYSLLHPMFEIGGVKIFGGWIGLSCRRRAAETKDPPVIPLTLMRQAEEAFFKIERPLRDGTLAVRNQRQALKAEQEKLAEDLRAAEKARQEAEARASAADTTPLRSELADVRGQLSASEGEKQVLQTSLEVERKASAGLQDQVSMLKAMLQFATSRSQDNAQETRLLEYSQEVRDLRTALDQKRDEIAERAEQIGRLNGRVEYFEEANKRLLAERDKFQSDCESGKARMLALESEREELRRTFDVATEQHKRADEAAQERLRSMEAELAEKARALSEAESKFADESKAHREALAKIDELGQQLETNVAQRAAQSEQTMAQAAQAEAQAARIKELEEALAGERGWEEQHKRECAAVQDRLVAAEKDLAAKVKALSAAETKCVAEEKLHKKFSSEAYNLGRQVAAQAVRIKELEGLLAGERSWTEQHKRECIAVQDRLTALESELAEKSKRLKKVSKAYEKLSKAKLGRLTLAYWRFKDNRRIKK